MYKQLILWAALMGVTVLVVNMVADVFYWYVTIPYFDKVVHTLGGLFVALAAAAVFIKHTTHIRNRDTAVVILLSVFIVGLLWEYYEYIVQFYIKSVHLADIPDSIGDLSADMLGGIMGTSFVIALRKRYNRR